MLESLQLTLAMLCLLAACSLSQERQERDSVKEEIDREVTEMMCGDQSSSGGFGASVQTCKSKKKK